MQTLRYVLVLATSVVGLLGEPGVAQTVLEPIPATVLPQESAEQILHRALHEAVWGPPVASEIRQQIDLNSHKNSGAGQFIRGGQGSGKMRMSMRIAAGDQLNTLLQVSDGELFYSQENFAKSSRRTRIDLGRVRQRLIITTQALNDPVIAMYLAIGGQAEQIRNLCQQYAWVEVKSGEWAGEPVWWLSGKLNPQRQLRALATIDQRGYNPPLSPLLPTEVRVAVGTDQSPVPYWLYHIEHRRPEEEPTPIKYKARMRITVEFPNPVPMTPADLTRDMFEFKLGNEQFTEETSLYLPPTPIAGSP